MKIAFAGTPEFAATVLRGLLASDHEVGLVISQPDARRSRGRKTAPTPVAALAREAKLPLLQPERISEATDEISCHDALVVTAYGQILPPGVLYAATHGAYNVHASLLPAYRGAAPVERAIMNGEPETGVSIIRMDEGLDTGPIALREKIPLPPETTGGELSEYLAELGANAIVESLILLEEKTLDLTSQDNASSSYAPKVSAEERVIDWSEGSEQVHNLVRALSPHIGARTFHPEVSGPVRVLRSGVSEKKSSPSEIGGISSSNGKILVGCGRGALEVRKLQMPGGKPVMVKEFLRGNTLGGSFHV